MNTKLAIDGGDPAVRLPLKPYNSYGNYEGMAAQVAMLGAQSGYLGGRHGGGPAVTGLEAEWAKTFGVKHAIAVNSATSGLLCAAAATVPKGGKFYVSPYTMSATAAAPALLGGVPHFADIEPVRLGIDPDRITVGNHAVFVTNLFGCPAKLHALRAICDKKGMYLVEDNAQAPFATEGGVYTGTIGHIGVFSLNVHKHIQCGEGGIVVTNDDRLAEKIRRFMNHGELYEDSIQLGMNLRMTEVTAAVARVQLHRGQDLVDDRADQARQLWKATKPHHVWAQAFYEWPSELNHVYYVWPFIYEEQRLKMPRKLLVEALRAEGVPLSMGYNPLHKLPAFKDAINYGCMTAENIDNKLVYFENCSYTLTQDQIAQFGEAFGKIEQNIKRLRVIK